MKQLILAVFLVAAGAIAWFALRSSGGDGKTEAPKPDGAIASKTPVPSQPQVEISFEYSTEKEQWLDSALADFEKDNPSIKVKRISKGSLESEASILDGTDKPVLWSPADSGVANLLAADWQTKTGSSPFVGKPDPLVLTPLVFVVWEDRAKVLLDASKGQITWKTIRDAVDSPKGWPAVGGKAAWGFVKLGQTDPTRSNSGLEALVVMAYEYFGGNKPLAVEQLLDPKFQAFVTAIEGSVPHFEASTGTFMTDMVRFGPSKYDIAVVYESLAISELAHAQGRWGSLHIYYPSVTVWSDHPIALLASAPAEQQAAAQKLIAYLKSTKVQTSALRFGFRPADPSVSFDAGGDNPFKKAQYGLTLELPPIAPVPDGAVVRNLMMLWSRVVKK
jgi:hypothetical protein